MEKAAVGGAMPQDVDQRVPLASSLYMCARRVSAAPSCESETFALAVAHECTLCPLVTQRRSTLRRGRRHRQFTRRSVLDPRSARTRSAALGLEAWSPCGYDRSGPQANVVVTAGSDSDAENAIYLTFHTAHESGLAAASSSAHRMIASPRFRGLPAWQCPAAVTGSDSDITQHLR